MPVMVSAARIHSLPPTLASQIAAGEVIERPASVVKELLENSLDAGARHIHVDIEAAGSRLIRVRDDGSGIHPDDLVLALAPQSTSKISAYEDLAAIRSLGFRGEALASIAAVARLRLLSQQADERACAIDYEPGMPIPQAQPAAHPRGTTVEVRDLFFNIPARRKFLRSEQTEFLHILEQVKALSLSHPGLGLKLRHNNRLVFSASARLSLPERIQQLFGSTFARQAWQVQRARNGLRVSGVAGGPATARSQADRQYLFLNGRLIRDRRLAHALRLAYTEQLPPGRFAPFVLYLEMDPSGYDVNVHPAKHEVRFRAVREVHDFLYSALREALERQEPFDYGPAAAERTEMQAPRHHDRVSDAGTADYQAPAPAVSPAEAGLGQALVRGPPGYLLAATATVVNVIDCRRAVSALTVIELEQALAAGTVGERPLLMPERVDADNELLAALERWQAVLEGLAIRFEPGGPADAVLRALPLQLPAIDTAGVPAALSKFINECPLGMNTVACRAGLIGLLADEAGRQHERVLQRLTDDEFVSRLQRYRAQGCLQPPWPWRVLSSDDLAALFSERQTANRQVDTTPRS